MLGYSESRGLQRGIPCCCHDLLGLEESAGFSLARKVKLVAEGQDEKWAGGQEGEFYYRIHLGCLTCIWVQELL